MLSTISRGLTFSSTRPSTDLRSLRLQPDQHAKLAPGSIIPDTRLEIVRWLGEGGMGTVFEVRHLDIDRRFAAKLLFRSESTAGARRFRREARTIGTIGSPWIVEIFDFKELPDGRLMYLMELVDGPTLLERCKQLGRFELGPLLGLARQICKGLADAHAHGFIHRDIKLENIMLAQQPDGRAQVKLVDFGLAGLLSDPDDASSSRAGTPAYMSPEVCKGEPADARTDIYSLGVVLYELATGRLPFCSDDPKTLIADHLRTRPEPPSALPGTHLPASFDALVLRCLAKQPEDRFANAAELEAALVELQLEQGLRTDADDLPAPPVVEPRRRRLEQGLARLRRDRQRDRWRRILAGAGLVAIIGLSASIGWRVGADSRDAAAAKDQVEVSNLGIDAKLAAAQKRWVYPAVDYPEAATAYRLLLELEAFDIDDAERFGKELRQEFATSLLELGNAYWDRPGGRSFAREFYAQVLVFDADQPLARERAGLTPTGSTMLRERAAIGGFDHEELVAVEPLAALAEHDPVARLVRLDELLRDPDAFPSSVGGSLQLLAEELERELPIEARPNRLAVDVHGSVAETTAPLPSLADTPLVETLASMIELPAIEVVEPRPSPIAAAPSHTPADGEASKREAAELAEQGKHAYRTGETREAERLYRAALALDPRNLAALLGLHHVHFDRGEYQPALDAAERAAALQPKRGDVQRLVGDACMKLADYDCARARYDRAAELGDTIAPQRLQMLAQRSSPGGALP